MGSGGIDMAEDVYCGECKHFNRAGPRGKGNCSCPENLGNWESRKFAKSSPEEINTLNDCKWFKEKRYAIRSSTT